MNGWGNVDAYKVINNLDTMSATIEVELAKDVEFKIADANWKHEFNFGKTQLDKTCFADKGGNIQCTKAGTYVITISKINTGNPECKIELKK